MCEEVLQIRRDMRWLSGIAVALIRLGQLALHEGNAVRARELFDESLAVWRKLGRAGGQTDVVWVFAGAAAIAGKNERAARLFGAAEASYKALKAELNRAEHLVYDPITETVRKQLGEARFSAAWAKGRTMTPEQALALAQAEDTIG